MDKIFKIIDVNLNRLAEGLRVLEEIFRFVEQNKELYSKIKEIRHEIRKSIENSTLLIYREIKLDIGRDSFTISEQKRESIQSIFNANLKRVQESLRVLEEFLKPVNGELSYLFKKFRFEIYKIEEEFYSIKRKFKEIIGKKPLLYGIIDTRFSDKKHIEICKELIKGGIKVIQLREKILNDRELLKIAKELSEICSENNIFFIVNDRVDIAYLSNASGVHLGQDDISLNSARKILGFNKIFGKSTHNLKQVIDVFKENPDYIGFGPVFETKSKENPDPVVGVGNLRKLKEQYGNIPVVAIGGINLKNIKEVCKCSPEFICIMSGIISKENILEEINKYRRIINDTA